MSHEDEYAAARRSGRTSLQLVEETIEAPRLPPARRRLNPSIVWYVARGEATIETDEGTADDSRPTKPPYAH